MTRTRQKVLQWTGIDAVVLVLALFPVFWLLMLSLKSPSTVSDGRLIPSSWSVENYKSIFQQDIFTRALVNSIGIALIATVLAVVLASGPGTYSVTAEFSEVNGLVEGAPVEVAGLRVGRVESIGLGGDGLPRVGMTVSDAYPLHSGASADLRVASASGASRSRSSSTEIRRTAGSGSAAP